MPVLSRRTDDIAPRGEQLTQVFRVMEDPVTRFGQTISDLTGITRIGKQPDGEGQPVAPSPER